MVWVLTLSLMLSTGYAGHSGSHVWRAATFRGLVVGKSNRSAMLRILGEPKWTRSHRQDDDEEEKDSRQDVFSHYETGGELPGSFTVVYDKRSGIIKRIESYPDKLTREKAVAHFGKDYIVTKYDFDKCKGGEDSELIYESSNGPLVSVEYRSRGIAISVGFNEMVTKISYVSGPIGAIKSRCKKEQKS